MSKFDSLKKYESNLFLRTYSKYIELFQCLIKLLVFIKLILFFGVFKGVLLIIFYIMSSNYFLKKFYKLEKLTTNDLLLLGFHNAERSNMICIFFFEKKFDEQSIRQRFIEKGLKLNKKFTKRLVRKFNQYYWEDVPIEEAIKRVRIVEDEDIYEKEDIINYSKREINRHLSILDELPYEIQLLKFKNRDAGAILFKLDHTMSDGLGMISLILTISDNFTDDIVPKILKMNKKIPLHYKLVMNILDLLLFPYYAIKLLLNGQVHASEGNPFKRTTPPSGNTIYESTNSFDFNKLHKLNRKLNISFNDLMLSIISASINKYSDIHELSSKYVYNKLICAIPIGLKDLPRNPEEVQLKNDILGAITEIYRIKDPLKEYNEITKMTKKTVKNLSNIRSWKYLEFIFNQFLPYFIQKAIAFNVASSTDLAISNLPGPTKEVYFCGCEVTDIQPLMSVSFGNCFMMVATYNNSVRLTVCTDKNLNIDLKLMTKLMNEEIKSAINKLE